MNKITLGKNLRYSPQPLSAAQAKQLQTTISEILNKQHAVIIAHYYTDPLIQELAEKTGGYVADSLEMARFGAQHKADTLIVAGVRFMGETAKILNPDKTVLMPTLAAECSLDIGCPADQLKVLHKQHPERKLVVYANTSAEVKAQADWVVTSSIAVDVIEYLDQQNEKILWAPDKYLGDYIQKKTQSDMLLWQGSCIVHEAFKAKALEDMQTIYPEAATLVHPESPESVIALADVVGSTSQLIKAAKNLSNQNLIVATDQGIFYKMQQAAPDKTLIKAPSAGQGATCVSCARCPWMAMNQLSNLLKVLQERHNEIKIEADIMEAARVPLERMLAFKKQA